MEKILPLRRPYKYTNLYYDRSFYFTKTSRHYSSISITLSTHKSEIMSNKAMLRLSAELRGMWLETAHFTKSVVFILELLTRNVDGFTAGLVSENHIYKWSLIIEGPSNSL